MRRLGCLSASLGYSPIKAAQLPEQIAVVLWLPAGAVHSAVKPAIPVR